METNEKHNATCRCYDSLKKGGGVDLVYTLVRNVQKMIYKETRSLKKGKVLYNPCVTHV